MDRELYEAAKPIFDAALELPPDQRGALLDTACAGAPELRRLVEELIASHDDSEPESAGLDMAVERALSAGEEAAGSRIGRYTLIDSIGEGGFGTVWRASEEAPIRREVALKILKLGMDTRRIVARFDAERQALALMDHPHIARVFDGGATESGRPYFAMELVDGVPITRFCRDAQLDLRGRLELFIKVCAAVQHAHQNGIVHRDIKPSNVLVAVHDDEPFPKVIDFGIAKATSGDLADQATLTRDHEVLGTPDYMAPEQLDLGTLNVDTRADVYSLGVLLYEVLTGMRPFDEREGTARNLDTLFDSIRRGTPPKPSARLGPVSRDDSSPTPRTTSASSLKGDLDWIVMRALEKERTERYQTVSALADDIQRHLRHEPVTAGPPSTGYRIRKFVRRHRGAVIAASFVLVALIAGLVSTGVALSWALKEKTRADEQAKRAEQRFGLALDAIEGYHTGIAEDSMLRRSDLSALRTKLLQAPRAFYERLIATFPDNPPPGQRVALSRALSGLARLSASVGERGDAITTYRQVVGVLLSLADDGIDATENRLASAELLGVIGRLEAEDGQLARAETTLRGSIRTTRELRDADPGSRRFDNHLADATAELGSVLRQLGRRDEAAAMCTKSLALYEALLRDGIDVVNVTKDVADVRNMMGRIALNAGRPGDAREMFQTAAQVIKALLDGSPNDADLMSRLATCNNNLGNACSSAGDNGAALAAYGRSIKLQRRLFDTFPSIVDYRYGLGNTLNALAGTYRGLGQRRDAARSYEKAIRLLEGARSLENRRFRAQALQNAGAFALDHDDVKLATRRYRAAVGVYEDLADESRDADVLSGAASCFNNLAGILHREGNTAEAQSLYRRAIELRADVLRAYPDSLEQKLNLCASLLSLARILRKRRAFAEAIELYDRSADVTDEIDPKAVRKNQRARYFDLHRGSYWGRANAHQMADEYVSAVADWKRAAQIDRGSMRAPYLTQLFGDLVRGNLVKDAKDDVWRIVDETGATAHDLYRIATAFLEGGAGPEYSAVARAVVNRGVALAETQAPKHLWRLLELQARYEERDEELQRAIETAERALGAIPVEGGDKGRSRLELYLQALRERAR